MARATTRSSTLVSRPLLFTGFGTVNVLPTVVTSASTKLVQEMTGPIAGGVGRGDGDGRRAGDGPREIQQRRAVEEGGDGRQIMRRLTIGFAVLGHEMGVVEMVELVPRLGIGDVTSPLSNAEGRQPEPGCGDAPEHPIVGGAHITSVLYESGRRVDLLPKKQEIRSLKFFKKCVVAL